MASLTFYSSHKEISADYSGSWLWAAVPLWLAYALIFAGTAGVALGHALWDAAANVVPLVLLALACRALLPRLLPRRPLPVQGAIHALAAFAFSSFWYVSLTVLLGLRGWAAGEGLRLVGFSGPALTWQMFQGGILYCAVAAIVLRPSESGGRSAARALHRYLIRDGEDLRPVDVAEIVTIRGAQDYSEVSTHSGPHLVRMSLGEFEARLDHEQFVRVHRSAIVHLRYLERLEPAGSGRMLAHMANGERVAVSRAGAQSLRLFVV